MTIKEDEALPNFRAPSGIFAEYLRRSISISYLVGLVLSAPWLVIAATIVGLFYGIYTVHRDGPSYTATIRIAPAETDNSLSGIGGAGGLLAGLSSGGAAVALPKFTQFMLAKASVGVAEDLDRKHDMLCRVFKSECDPVKHQWKKRTGIKETFNSMLARLAGLPDPNGPRTIQDLAAYVSGAVITEENKNNSMVMVRYTNSKPEFASEFLSAVIKSSNDYIRAQSRETQRRYVEYLSNSASKTTNVEQRMAIDALLLQEERQLMMTEVDIPYAAKILDGPTIQPVNNALKTIAIDGILGTILGILAALCRDLLPRKWHFW